MSPQRGPQRKGNFAPLRPAPPRARPRTLSGATILQIVPALRDEPAGHAAVDIALALLQSGARAVIAGEGGPLVGELRALGGEWLPMVSDTVNPLRLKKNARTLENMIAAERVDIVHAQSAGAAWSALSAKSRLPVRLVTSFPDQLAADTRLGTMFRRSLARGDRVIAPSSFIAQAMMERYKIMPERISVIPRSVDTGAFNPARMTPERIAAMRRAWGVLPQFRVVLIPGRIAPWNGQLVMADAARLLVGGGERNVAFVFAGDDRSQPRYVRAFRRRAHMQRVDTLFRMTGYIADMPAALAAADVVVVPAMEPPLSGRAVAEAQAMGRPVVTHAVGVLPENVLAPPRMPDNLRTGWVVRPGNIGELAQAMAAALALDHVAYEALGARARQYAEFVFSRQSVAEAIRGVYTSLLARDA
ncbi:MAG: glycosyltransferase [Pseudolabrys sp.]